MDKEADTKGRISRSWFLLLGVAVVFAAATAHILWPRVKGHRQTPEATVGLDEAGVSLTGIFYTEDNPLAVVNGRTVREEDVIDGIKVLKIHKHKVEFEESGRRWTEHMPAMKEGVASGFPTLLELGAKRCPPCRRMMPILDGLKAKYADKFHVTYIDVDKNPGAGAKYGVRSIPTQIFYDKEGIELFRHVGFYSKKDILDAWEQCGVKVLTTNMDRGVTSSSGST